MRRHPYPASARPGRHDQCGFTLLEVLIALLVLSIGLLGLAALQTVGLKFTHESYQRTQAVIQAYDMLDRIRANPGGRTATGYNNVSLGSIPSLSGINCTGGTGCSPSQLATFDVSTWNTTNASLLKQGQGAVCLGNFSGSSPNVLTACTAGGSIYRVGVTWIENDIPITAIVEAQL